MQLHLPNLLFIDVPLNEILNAKLENNESMRLISLCLSCRCGNVAAILELDEHLQRDFTIFEAAPQETRGVPSKKPQPDYFL